MRVTIIKSDNAVYVDGHALGVDCSSLPPNFHALQWYGTWGEIEYNANGVHSNRRITDITPYMEWINKHAETKAQLEAAAKAAAPKSGPGGMNVIAG